MRFYSGSTAAIFGIVMMIVVCVLGITVLFTDWQAHALYGWKRPFFVVLMFAYAAYRGLRIYQTYKQQKLNDE